MGYSVGIGLTNDCNLQCAHCYRDTDNIRYLPFADVQSIYNALPIDSIGLGTGENALHPEFEKIIRFLSKKNIKLSVASNGYTLTTISDDLLSCFHDIEVSIDFPAEELQDEFRGSGNWALVHSAIDRCHEFNIEVSILSTMMAPNYMMMDQMVGLARHNQTNLRVNAYQPVKTDAFLMTYDQFWEGYQRLFSEGLLVSCSEPVVRAVLGLDDVFSPCGHKSIRINPAGQVLPCVYWPSTLDHNQKPLLVADLLRLKEKIFNTPAFKAARADPNVNLNCPCHGGCASRRALRNQIDDHDEYCPWVRGETIDLKCEYAPIKELARIGNCCTTIVI